MVEWKTIGDISINVFAGGTPSTKHEEYYDGDIPWIRSGEIDFNTITKAERNITQEGYDNSPAKLIRNGSVVMAMTGATVAKTAIVEFETSANQSVCAIETDESIANYKYVYFYLAKDYFKIKSSAQGALTSLNLAMIKQIEIPIPSLQEQERIVGILDTFTASIDNLKAQIEQRRKQYEHYRDQLLDLEGKEGVEWKKIEDLGSFFGGLTGKRKEDFVDGNARFITYMNVFSNPSLDTTATGSVRIGEKEKQNKIQKGDILFTGSSETPDEAGMSCVVTKDLDDDYYMNSFCFGIRITTPSLYNLDYLKHLLRSSKTRKNISKSSSGVTRFNVSKARFGKILIPIPSLQEQERIVGILDTFTASIVNLEAQLEQRQKQYEYYREKLLTFE